MTAMFGDEKAKLYRTHQLDVRTTYRQLAYPAMGDRRNLFGDALPGGEADEVAAAIEQSLIELTSLSNVTGKQVE